MLAGRLGGGWPWAVPGAGGATVCLADTLCVSPQCCKAILGLQDCLRGLHRLSCVYLRLNMLCVVWVGWRSRYTGVLVGPAARASDLQACTPVRVGEQRLKARCSLDHTDTQPQLWVLPKPSAP